MVFILVFFLIKAICENRSLPATQKDFGLKNKPSVMLFPFTLFLIKM